MTFQYWWLIPLWLIAILIVVLVLRNKRKVLSGVATAHTKRLEKLPSFKRVFARYKLLLFIAMAVTVVGVLTAAFISARPTSDNVQPPQHKNRDILLCLDVSNSMATLNASVFDVFGNLVKQYDGQRIGLTVFNSVAVTVFPLTDDYELIAEQLEVGKRGFEMLAAVRANGGTIQDLSSSDYSALMSIIDGASSNYQAGASLIGDGLTGCADRLGKNESKRSQSIILVTDNQISGKPIVTLNEAAALIKNQGVRVYALDPNVSTNALSKEAIASNELKSVALTTGGNYFPLDDPLTLPNVIDSIDSQEATYFASKSDVVTSDTPLAFLVVMISAFIVLAVVAWRLSL